MEGSRLLATGQTIQSLGFACLLGSLGVFPLPQRNSVNRGTPATPSDEVRAVRQPRDSIGSLPETENTDDSPSAALDAGTFITGILLIVVGFAMTFFGGRFVRVGVFFSSALLFATLSYITLINIEPELGWNSRVIIYVVVVLLALLLGGALGLLLYKLGIFFLGATGGVYFSLFILGFFEASYLLAHPGIRVASLTVVGVLFGISSLVFETWFMRIGTALAGSAAFVLGVDTFVAAGLWRIAHQVLASSEDADESVDVYDTRVYILLVTYLVLAIGGIFVQLRFTAPIAWPSKQT